MIRTVHIRTSNLDEYLILIKLLRNVENITSIYYLWIFPCWIDQAYTVVDMLCSQSMWFIWMLFGLFLIFMDRSEGFHACWSLPVKKISVNWGDSSQTGQPGKQRIKHIEIRRSPDRFSKATHFGEIIYSTYSWLNRLSPLLRHAKKAHQFSKSSTKQIPFFGSSILWVRSNLWAFGCQVTQFPRAILAFTQQGHLRAQTWWPCWFINI